ncbi:MAG TPA: hypothetical protein VF884_11065 [Nitrososphaeraceae archaeon]
MKIMNLRFPSIGVALTVVVFLSLFFLNLYTSYGASISDKKLKVQTIAKGLSSPTSMTFIDNKNIVVLEKNWESALNFERSFET